MLFPAFSSLPLGMENEKRKPGIGKSAEWQLDLVTLSSCRGHIYNGGITSFILTSCSRWYVFMAFISQYYTIAYTDDNRIATINNGSNKQVWRII
jgi:hypothetical protein